MGRGDERTPGAHRRRGVDLDDRAPVSLKVDGKLCRGAAGDFDPPGGPNRAKDRVRPGGMGRATRAVRRAPSSPPRSSRVRTSWPPTAVRGSSRGGGGPGGRLRPAGGPASPASRRPLHEGVGGRPSPRRFGRGLHQTETGQRGRPRAAAREPRRKAARTPASRQAAGRRPQRPGSPTERDPKRMAGANGQGQAGASRSGSAAPARPRAPQGRGHRRARDGKAGGAQGPGGRARNLLVAAILTGGVKAGCHPGARAPRRTGREAQPAPGSLALPAPQSQEAPRLTGGTVGRALRGGAGSLVGNGGNGAGKNFRGTSRQREDA